MKLCCKPMSLLSITLTLHILHLFTLSQCQSGADDLQPTPAAERNCTTSFTVLEENMLSHEQNRYNLLKTFYPPRGAPTYYGDIHVWRLTEPVSLVLVRALYLIQPLDVLQYTSLFHSNFDYREGKLDLRLAKECAETRSEFMELLTQRVSVVLTCWLLSIEIWLLAVISSCV